MWPGAGRGGGEESRERECVRAHARASGHTMANESCVEELHRLVAGVCRDLAHIRHALRAFGAIFCLCGIQHPARAMRGMAQGERGVEREGKRKRDRETKGRGYRGKEGMGERGDGGQSRGEHAHGSGGSIKMKFEKCTKERSPTLFPWGTHAFGAHHQASAPRALA